MSMVLPYIYIYPYEWKQRINIGTIPYLIKEWTIFSVL